jgi:hypothetical protein
MQDIAAAYADSELPDDEPMLPETVPCMQTIDIDEEGNDVFCGAPCDPTAQICLHCRTNGHHSTGLL